MINKLLPITFVFLIAITNIVKANDDISLVNLESCIKKSNEISNNQINEMVVALYLEKMGAKQLFGTEMLTNDHMSSNITSRSVLRAQKSLIKNVVNVKIDGTNYACYPKSQK